MIEGIPFQKAAAGRCASRPPATEEDLVPPTRRFYDGPLEVGHDLMAITIGAWLDVTTRDGTTR
jgi:hypothetical protein